MENIKLENVRIFQDMFNFIENRGSELVEMHSYLDPKTFGDYYCARIAELNDVNVGFECEHSRYNETGFKYFTYEQLLNNEYYKELQSRVKTKKQAEILAEKKKIEEEKKIARQKEIEMFNHLKEKYGDL